MAFKPWSSDVATPDASQKKINQVFENGAQAHALRQMNCRVLSGDGVPGTGCGLAAGSNGASQIKTGTLIVYTIDGRAYSLAGTSYINFPAFANPTQVGVLEGPWATQGTGSVCKYLISVGTDGTAASGAGGITVSQGNFATSASEAKLPDCPDGNCAIGYVQITTTTAGFVPGTTAINAAWVTDVYVDLLTMPASL